MAKPENRGDYVQSIERGLSVILAFADQHPQLSISALAEVTGLSKPTVRRIALTLEELGYLRRDGRLYSLTPHVLALGNAYLSSMNLTEVAQPYMEEVTSKTGQTCSMAALDGEDAVQIARVPAGRVLSITLTTGTRLPAYATSMGRVLVASLTDGEIERFLAQVTLHPLTPRTTTDPDQLREILLTVREQGWALVDQELEEGVRSFSAPVRDSTNRVVASLSMSCHATKVSLETIHDEYLPILIKAAGEISSRLGATV